MAVKLVYSRQKKTCNLKDDKGKLRVEAIIAIF